MSITIKAEPQEFQSAYNEVIVVLDSTNRNEDKFQYVVDITVNGTYSSRLKIQSNPQGWGIINLSKHLEGAISTIIPDFAETNIFNALFPSFATYSVALSEEFVEKFSYNAVSDSGGNALFTITAPHSFVIGDSVDVTTITGNTYTGFQTVLSVPSTTSIVTSQAYTGNGVGTVKLSSDVPTETLDAAAVFSETKYVTNNVLDFVEVPSWDSAAYALSAGTTRKFYTNLPTTYYSRLDDSITMNIKPDANNVVTYLKLTTNNGDFFFHNQHFTTADTTKFQSVKVGVADFTDGAIHVGAPNGSLPMFDDSTESYTIQTVGADFTTVSSEERTFIIDRTCTAHENVKLIYLNNGGSFSPFNFAGASVKSVKVKKKNYQKSYGSYNDTTGTYGWNTHDSGSTRLSTSVNEKWKLNTTFIPDAIGDLIEDLIISPQVYRVYPSGLVRAVEVITSSVKIKQRATDKLISYSVDIEYSTNNSTQK
jgi:hypothetical protein